MATPANQLIRDQNINFSCDGSAFGMNTNNFSKAETKRRVGARRALNDISNSTKPSALQASKKTNSSVISVGADDPKTKFSAGGKVNTSRVGGRKALGDLTNTSNLTVKQVTKKGHEEKMSFVVEEEGFLHNHQKCIKEQRKVMDMDCFLKEVGLSNASSMPLLLTPHAYPPSWRSKLKTPVNVFKIEEELLEEELEEPISPVCMSPMSPKSPNWLDVKSPCFSLIETPMPPKYC